MSVKCSVEVCDRQAVSKGYCRSHYAYWWSTGRVPTHKIRTTKWVGHTGPCLRVGCPASSRGSGYCDRHLWRSKELAKYGLTFEDYDRMFDEQSGRCRVCSLELVRDSKSAHVDHCHSTGRVRALLCRDCNLGLGNFHDDVLRLRSAAAYLLQFQ